MREEGKMQKGIELHEKMRQKSKLNLGDNVTVLGIVQPGKQKLISKKKTGEQEKLKAGEEN